MSLGHHLDRHFSSNLQLRPTCWKRTRAGPNSLRHIALGEGTPLPRLSPGQHSRRATGPHGVNSRFCVATAITSKSVVPPARAYAMNAR